MISPVTCVPLLSCYLPAILLGLVDSSPQKGTHCSVGNLVCQIWLPNSRPRFTLEF
jgi:hypothetical protein